MNDGKLVIGFAGDVMIGRNVNAMMDRKGFPYIWGDLLPLLLKTDLNIVNLETALTDCNRQVPKVFNFKASPDKIIALTNANVQIVNLANNHVLDFETEGLLETLKTLDAAGIKHTGAGIDSEAAATPAVFTRNGISIGVLGFTDNEPTWKASAGKPGVNYIDISRAEDRANALLSVECLHKQADIVVISIHWGPNMNAYPDKLFIDFAHAMIRHGASIIHGHSAHNFQGIEVVNRRLIFYDTGDFIDDYAVHPELRNDHSFFFQVEVTKDGISSAWLTPVLISNCKVNLAVGDDYRWSLHRVQELSARMDTVINDNGDIQLSKISEQKNSLTLKL